MNHLPPALFALRQDSAFAEKIDPLFIGGCRHVSDRVFNVGAGISDPPFRRHSPSCRAGTNADDLRVAVFKASRYYGLASAEVNVFRRILKLLDPVSNRVAELVILLVSNSKGDAFLKRPRRH
ncbi:hypothetical protein FHX10_003229 [Rhizobium sp. BK591]|nr:hypothetical protein [Rhizobium sp. BK591]